MASIWRKYYYKVVFQTLEAICFLSIPSYYILSTIVLNDHVDICIQEFAFFYSSSLVDMDWKHGSTVASAQNFARELMEMPCNYLTPAKFVEIVSDKLTPVADKMQYIGRYGKYY